MTGGPRRLGVAQTRFDFFFLRELLTVDLQHGRGLRLAHAVLRRAGVRALILLPHAEQAEAVAVADLEPGGDNRGEVKVGWWRSGPSRR